MVETFIIQRVSRLLSESLSLMDSGWWLVVDSWWLVVSANEKLSPANIKALAPPLTFKLVISN
ncbi:MAG: hypothetical protein AAFW70_12475 [Cyanobacteria bacterium J06635_10]